MLLILAKIVAGSSHSLVCAAADSEQVEAVCQDHFYVSLLMPNKIHISLTVYKVCMYVVSKNLIKVISHSFIVT